MKQLNAQFNNINFLMPNKPSSSPAKSNTPTKCRNQLVHQILNSKQQNQQNKPVQLSSSLSLVVQEKPFEYEKLKKIELLRKTLRQQQTALFNMLTSNADDQYEFYLSLEKACKEVDLNLSVKSTGAYKCELFLDIFRIFSYNNGSKDKCKQTVYKAALSILTSDCVLTYSTITTENNEKIVELFSPEFSFVDADSTPSAIKDVLPSHQAIAKPTESKTKTIDSIEEM
jgi:hypothetical protein